MGMTIDSDIRRRAAARRSPLTFIRENWRAITLYLVITGALLLGLTQATEITVGILQFIAQLLFAMMFLIVQFGALFYILGRGRTYWVQPGETGVWFSDYRGNDQILEVARRVVTLLRGVRALSDFEYEFELSMMNKALFPAIETIFLPTDQKYFVLRSSGIKEVAGLGGDVSAMVPEVVAEALAAKLGPAAT